MERTVKSVIGLAAAAAAAVLWAADVRPAEACTMRCYDLVNPPDGAAGVPTNTHVWVHEPRGALMPALYDADGNPVEATVVDHGHYVELVPAAELLPEAVYTMALDYPLTTFTTAAGPESLAPPAVVPTIAEVSADRSGFAICGGSRRWFELQTTELAPGLSMWAVYLLPPGTEVTLDHEPWVLLVGTGGIVLDDCLTLPDEGEYDVFVAPVAVTGEIGPAVAGGVVDIPRAGCSVAGGPGRAGAQPTGALAVALGLLGVAARRRPRRP